MYRHQEKWPFYTLSTNGKNPFFNDTSSDLSQQPKCPWQFPQLPLQLPKMSLFYFKRHSPSAPNSLPSITRASGACQKPVRFLPVEHPPHSPRRLNAHQVCNILYLHSFVPSKHWHPTLGAWVPAEVHPLEKAANLASTAGWTWAVLQGENVKVVCQQSA